MKTLKIYTHDIRHLLFAQNVELVENMWSSTILVGIYKRIKILEKQMRG